MFFKLNGNRDLTYYVKYFNMVSKGIYQMRKITIQKAEDPKVGGFLKKLRQKFYLSQEEISKRIGVSRPTLIKIEANKADITLLQAKKLADYYNISLNDLLRAEDTVNFNVRHSMKDLVSKDPLSSFDKEAGFMKAKEFLIYSWGALLGHPDFTEVNVQNLLFLIEANYFKEYRSPIFGLNYLKNKFGAVVKNYSQIVNDLANSNDLELINSKKFVYPNIKYLPLRHPNFSKMTANEKKIIDQIITTVENNGINYIPRLLCEVEQYKIASEGQEISLYTQ